MTNAKLLESLGVIILYRMVNQGLRLEAQKAWGTILKHPSDVNIGYEAGSVLTEQIDEIDISVIQNWYNDLFEGVVLERFPSFRPAPKTENKRAILNGNVAHFRGELPHCYAIYMDFQELDKRCARLERVLSMMS
ncbi:hypothetical protein [Brevibacillus reuszeri]|uniref:hypothetical protein n=1 Tax=Brevibacillus reuszeri TaxID=54915 RepID=UPI003D1C9DF3